MEENMKRNGCRDHQGPNLCDRKVKECDIESICCDDFVKEQFSLRTIATNTVVIAYQSTGGNIARGTVKVQNLSSNTSINFTVAGPSTINIVVAPNQEAAITAADLTSVRVQSIVPGSLAGVKLCFDLQVASLGD
ncbi:hypothetical protein J1C67_13440 [Clostridium gasigenes]|uniref:S-Ena type endospore appendage n=1 Tax=Clostridium gasigenes TaxID=94869 RepID=UPI00143864E8|nr:S-Ena type endospore appendage [Clostridium gasigenes]MBU3131298.1 hypothetical protein [Clostridium gasigenes]NKF08101.1 hypothetical protein [Clostridium gasigenes]QSW18544.1 hypothetical protein J1C67_13440 [Clostridium gasigenes]